MQNESPLEFPEVPFVWDPGGIDIILEPKSVKGIQLGGLSSEEITKSQSQDSDMFILFQWLLDKSNEPSESSLFLNSPASKFYWINRELFKFTEDGIVVRKDPTSSNEQIVISKEMHEDILKLGQCPIIWTPKVCRTKDKIREKYFCYGMTKDIRKYILECNECSLNKKNQVVMLVIHLRIFILVLQWNGLTWIFWGHY